MRFLVILVLSFLVAPLAIDAQPPAKIPRLGMLLTMSRSSLRGWKGGYPFLQALRELGYVEGQTIAFEYRFADGHYDRLPQLAADLVRLGVDIIMTDGAPATQAAMHATTTIPIVLRYTTYAVETDLAASLARPGGNVTGVAAMDPEMAGKQLELLREAVPGLSRVGVLWEPEDAGSAVFWRQMQVEARKLGLTLSPLEVSGSSTLEHLFAAITRERPDALYVFPNPFPWMYRQAIADFALKSRLPMFGPRWLVDLGGLMAYGASSLDLARRAASYVDRILKGAKPAELPVERPTKYELVINLKAAKALRLTIPQSVLLRADHVIE
jgi:putative ABC transport system substrate-binding protein